MRRLTKLMTLVVVALVASLAMAGAAWAANATATVDSGKGGPGSITIAGTNPDQTYTFYRLFSATPNNDGSSVSYKYIGTAPAEGNEFYTYFGIDSAGNVTIKDAGKDSSDATKLSAAAIEYLNAHYSDIASSAYYSTKVGEGESAVDLTVTGLEYGYYYITTTTGTIVSVDTVQPNATTEEKNPNTTVDKSITGVADGSIDADGAKALAQVGTTVDYQSRIPIANGARNYVFTDTMTSGLTLDSSSVKVYLTEKDAAVAEGATAETEGTANENQFGTLTAANQTADTSADITITFNQAWLSKNVGKDIVVQYSATVNKDAVISGTTGNPNTAKINWGDTSNFLTDTDEASVFSAKIDVTKVDGSGEPLAGAGFVLKNSEGYYYKNTDGIVSWVAENGSPTEYTTEVKDGAAVVTFSGLADGTYTLIEKTVPGGYNKAADQVIVINQSDVTVSNTAKAVSVTNQSGTELPSTGGIGTTILYIIGAVLVIGAGVFLVTKRRMRKEDNVQE